MCIIRAVFGLKYFEQLLYRLGIRLGFCLDPCPWWPKMSPIWITFGTLSFDSRLFLAFWTFFRCDSRLWNDFWYVAKGQEFDWSPGQASKTCSGGHWEEVPWWWQLHWRAWTNRFIAELKNYFHETVHCHWIYQFAPNNHINVVKFFVLYYLVKQCNSGHNLSWICCQFYWHRWGT